jgi:putative ABC transport system permease protein
VGIAACMMAITLYHARTGQPIPWKHDTLYAVTLDTRNDSPPQAFERHPEYPPFQLTYLDAKALYASKIPVHAVMMYRAGRTLTPAAAGMRPFPVNVRVTTADFFATFDVPFLYGSGWTRADDDTPLAAVVISRYMNQKLFAGADGVGREVILEGIPYRVIGVLGPWTPQPRYYDLSGTGFDIPEDIYMPFGWMHAAQILPNGDVYFVNDHPAGELDSLHLFTTSDCCAWLQYWVELHGRADRERFQAFVDSYTGEQRRLGRFPRRNNNRIVDVPTWLSMWDVVGDDSRLQLLLGGVFLAVCVLNTLGLMLARFLRAAPGAALRRALGASRIDIVRQHLVEVVLAGALGGALGVALTGCGLTVVRSLLYAGAADAAGNPDQLTVTQALVHIDLTVLAWAVALSILGGLLAGLYPALRIGRLAPATFLKAQ